jgi:hypothetical protein
MRRIYGALLFLLLTVVTPTCAQQLSLPSFDGITVFYRAGRLSGYNELRASPTAPCAANLTNLPACGWGFETVYHLTKDDEDSPWGAELAVGYDFLTLHATIGDTAGYELRGSMQTLPSLTLYVSHDIGKQGKEGKRAAFYLGLGTGITVLKNVHAYDSIGRIYSISGDAWAFTPSIGTTYELPIAEGHGLGASVFVEAAYEVRDFTSIAYTLPSKVEALPADLPRSLSASGPVLNFGFEINFRKKKPAPALKLGQSIKEVEAVLGEPKIKLTEGPKITYIYDSLKVIFTDGKVTEFK